MSDYSNTFGGAAKDSSQSLILGSDFDTEFDNLATMSATKANKKVPATTGNYATLSASGDLADAGDTVSTKLDQYATTLTAANKVPYATALNTAGELDFLDEDTMSSDSATALASQQSIKAYVDTTTAAVYTNGDALVAGTAQASTSGTSIDFTSIPSWAKKITLMLNGVSIDATTNLIVQIGDSGGLETTGYLSAAGAINGGATANGTTGFIISVGTAAATVHNGMIVVAQLDSATNTWASHGNIGLSNAAQVYSSGGSKALSAALDRISLTTVSGTANFDAGLVNILYE